MCRLRTNFARLRDPLQGLHKRKQANRASLVGNAPLSPPTAVLLHGKACHWIFGSFHSPTNPVPLPPRRGKFALRSASKLTSTSRHSAAKTSPSGGGAAAGGRRGAFPRATGAVGLFSLARQGDYKGFINWRRSRPPQPFEPSAPFEPFEPSRPQGRVHKAE